MATTYRNSSTANTGSTAATSLAVNIPSGIQTGDLLLAGISVDGAATITAPTGWAAVSTSTQGTNLRLEVYSRLVTGYESASYTWTFNSSQQAAGIMIAYSGTSGFTPATSSLTNSGTPSTTVTATSVNNLWAGMTVGFIGTKNMIGSCTITTPFSGWTQRADTCTTSADFIEIEVQELVRTFQLGGVPAPSATASQLVTYATVLVSVDDAHGTVPLAIDEVFNTGFTGVTSASLAVTTNYPNELLLALVALETGTVNVSSFTDTLAWTNITSVATQGGDCEIWYALAPTKLTNHSIVANFSASVTSGDYMIVGLSGVDLNSGNGSSAIGAFATANNAASSQPSVSLTTTRNNSWVFALGNSSNTNKLTSIVGATQTMLHSHNNGTSSSSFMTMLNTATPDTGTSVSLSNTNTTVTDWNMAAVEILPSLGHGLLSGGVGN